MPAIPKGKQRRRRTYHTCKTVTSQSLTVFVSGVGSPRVCSFPVPSSAELVCNPRTTPVQASPESFHYTVCCFRLRRSLRPLLLSPFLRRHLSTPTHRGNSSLPPSTFDSSQPRVFPANTPPWHTDIFSCSSTFVSMISTLVFAESYITCEYTRYTFAFLYQSIQFNSSTHPGILSTIMLT